MSLELSPGFFSLNNPIKYVDSDSEEEPIVPIMPSIERSPERKPNIVIQVLKFIVLTQKPCNCNTDGWSRTGKY